MGSLQRALQWAIATCNAPNVRYSQVYRKGEEHNGYIYYDCSSFVSQYLVMGGFLDTNPWFVVSTQEPYMLQAGFVRLPITSEWKTGDVVMRSTHTEVVYDGASRRLMGAHSDSVEGDLQVSINTWSSSPSEWEVLYRWNGADIPVEYNWHAKPYGAYSRTSQEAIENACMIYQTLAVRGWTLNAVSGLLGNMGSESGYNPWRWQNDVIREPSTSGLNGYGLVQFTPDGKYILNTYAQSLISYAPNYLNHAGDPHDGEAQMIFVNDRADYYPTQAYPLTYQEFKESNLSAEELAKAWLYNYERPQDPSATEQQRAENARYWYDLLQNIIPRKKKKKMPLYMMIRRW